ncbi:FAD-binding domain-containing protein [Exidia glandulosa HHB12029]|uniref:FAD-binding domain-containing protein n=1 Tax=Exidia glandulosa HHB12029 TaxID=1314781 RepID=A0A165QHS1_EXIGL|nr:FAD-binding domain-containing protein [Exidia glandulosa HHB12029]
MAANITEEFRAQFTGEIVTPADGAAYEAAIARWAKNAARKAAAVVYPKSTADIALALQLELPVAVRGGAHSASGASSCEGGLVIDLSRHFTDVRVDVEKQLAYVGGGAVWKTVDEAAIKHGLATVGGTVNHTGVGGLVLGGGYGWLTARHGLAIDNFVQATVVTASGEVVTASDSSNADLMNALRGGGCNFGVVTEFVLRLHPQRPTVYCGPLVFPGAPELLDPLRERLAAWWSTAGDDEAAIFGVAPAPGGGPPVFVFIVFYNGDEDEGKKRIQPFLDLNPIVNGATTIPYEAVNGIQNDGVPWGGNVYMKGTGTVLTELLQPSDTRLRDLVTIQQANNPAGAVLFEFFPLHNVVSRDKEGAHAFRGRATNNVLCVVQWKDGDTKMETGAGVLARDLVSTVGDASVSYGNYDDDPAVRTESKARRQFGDAYEHLQNVKARYDPGLRFDRWFPIVPKA